MGHSLSLNDTHCRLAGSMMSTLPLVPLTASVPLMTMLRQMMVRMQLSHWEAMTLERGLNAGAAAPHVEGGAGGGGFAGVVNCFMLLPAVSVPLTSAPTTVTLYCTQHGQRGCEGITWRRRTLASTALGQAADENMPRRHPASLTCVPGFSPVKVPTLVLLLNTSTGQAGQAASRTVNEYCSRQQGTAQSGKWRHSRAWRGAQGMHSMQPPCDQQRTSTNALVGSGSAVAVPVVELVAAAESRLSSGGVVTSPSLGTSVSPPFLSTQMSVTL